MASSDGTTESSPLEELATSLPDGKKTFSSWDYAVFSLLFVVSSLVGLYFAFKDRKKKSSDDYLLGNRKMQGLPVALSLTASFMSAITVMGTPAEIYRYGTMFLWFFFAYTATVVLTAEIFAPIFYKLGISSAYEYLELRFSRGVRMAGTLVFTFQMCVYMGMVMYMPALALNKVTGLSLVLSICGTSAVCTFYTTIGGLKAVIWTDVLQCLVMWGGFMAVIVEGSKQVGGIQNVFKIASEDKRIDFLRFDVDPRIRHSVWSVFIGGTFMWLSVYGVNQSMVQRYLSCRTLKQAKLALYVNDIGLLLVIFLASLTGLVMYAVYRDCDPLAAGMVEKSDQLVPYLVMDILLQYPGIPGLFVACAYSGTLSTVSTGINALACTTLEDIVKRIKPDISNRASVIISKACVVLYGLVGLGIAFLVSLLDQILTMALKMFGVIGGPLLGIFCLGIFTELGNAIGAYVGLVCGLVMGFWLAIGSNAYPPTSEFTRVLPTSVQGCDIIYNTSAAINGTEYPAIANEFYTLSYCHYSTVLVLGTWLIGYIVSLISSRWYKQPVVDLRLLAFARWRKSCRKEDNYVEGKEASQLDDMVREKSDAPQE